MNPPDVTSELAQHDSFTNFELRTEWRRLHRRPAPRSLSRELLLLGLAYKIQEQAFGGLSKSAICKLSKTSSLAEETKGRRTVPRLKMKPGTRLIREWNGQTHTVLVHDDSIEWRGRRYRSLSHVARVITGAHWSGPRFFGLRPGGANE